MAEPFLSEIRIVSFDFAPKGWATCDGQFLPINQNQGLFSLLGTTYGGDGRTNFALPNLRGRTPIHFGDHSLGEAAGSEAVTITIGQLPTHTHVLQATSNTATDPIPTSSLMMATASADLYGAAQSLVAMNAGVVGNVGGSQAHLNLQPFLTLNFCIALQGIFPSQT